MMDEQHRMKSQRMYNCLCMYIYIYIMYELMGCEYYYAEN